jgi:3-oxoacyl-[acyl-carrier protein] reductase
MEIDLTGKFALVGGSTDGIGKAIATRLAASGASVCIMARNKSKLEKVVNELDTSRNQKHKFLEVDFSNYNLFSKSIKYFFETNHIDILVNNTQGPEGGSALEKSIDDYQSAFDLLFKCAVKTSLLALTNMKDKKWGRIINVASISVKEPLNYLVLSNSLRSALVTWSKTLSVDIAKFNITINNVLTGYFNTERLKQLNSKKAKKLGINISKIEDKIKDTIPMKRFGNPEEYANLVCFLASEKSDYITGINIPIDGGFLKSL